MDSIAVKSALGARQADKVLEALATLAALIDRSISEVKSLDKDFQDRLLQAVHETEESLQAQAAEQVERTRNLVRDELTRKFQDELQGSLDALRAEFRDERERLEKEAAEQVGRVRQEANAEVTRNFQKDMQHALESLKAEFHTERERLDKEVRHAVEAASRLESERSGLIAEMERVREDARRDVEKAREEARAAATAAATPEPGGAPAAGVTEEIARAEAQLAEIIKVIEDPTTQLSAVIRKNVEKSEVEAYLRGIRYVLSGGKS